MPEQQAKEPEGSITIKDAASQINSLLDNDGHFNPDGTDSRALDPDKGGDGRQRNDKGQFKKTGSDDGNDANVGLTDEEVQAREQDALKGATSDDDSGGTTDDEGDDENDITTFLELAEVSEVPIDLLMGLNVSYGEGDDEISLSISDLVTGHKDSADVQGSRAKLADERRTFERESGERLEAMTAQANVMAQQFNMVEQMIMAKAQDPRFLKLRDDNPMEFMAQENDLRNQVGQLQQARAQAAQQYEQYRVNYMNSFVAREQKALKEVYPDWGDSHQTKVKATMETLGFQADEVKVFDSRYVRGLMELHDLRTEVAEFRKLKKTAAQTAQRVKKTVPKLSKPGKQRGQGGLNRERLTDLKKRFNKSHHEKDAAKIIEQMDII